MPKLKETFELKSYYIGWQFSEFRYEMHVHTHKIFTRVVKENYMGIQHWK